MGAAATWTLVDSERVTATSTTVTIEVTRAECSSGVTGAIAQPVVSLGIDDIIIRVDAEPLPGNEPQNCQGNDSVQMTVSLHEPIGDRALVDAACLKARQSAPASAKPEPPAGAHDVAKRLWPTVAPGLLSLVAVTAWFASLAVQPSVGP